MGLVSGVRCELRSDPDHRWVHLDYFAQAGQVPLETRRYKDPLALLRHSLDIL